MAEIIVPLVVLGTIEMACELIFDNQTDEELIISKVGIDSFDFQDPASIKHLLGQKIIARGSYTKEFYVKPIATNCPIHFVLTYEDKSIDRFTLLTKWLDKVVWSKDAYKTVVQDAKSNKMYTKNEGTIEEEPLKQRREWTFFTTESLDHSISLQIRTGARNPLTQRSGYSALITISYTRSQIEYRQKLNSLALNLGLILQKKYDEAKGFLSKILDEAETLDISTQAQSMLSDAYEAEANDKLTIVDKLLNSPDYDYTKIEKLYAETIAGYQEAKRLNRTKRVALNKKITDVKHLQSNNKYHNELTEQSAVMIDKLNNLVKTNSPKDRREVIKDLDGLIIELQLVKNGYKKGQKGNLNVEVASEVIHKQLVVMKDIVLKLKKDQLNYTLQTLNIKGLNKKQNSTLKGHVEYVRQIDVE